MGRIVNKIRQARFKHQIRLGRDVSIQEVATAVGISRSALSKIEKEQAWPSKDVLEGLCKFYGVPLEELVSYTEDDRQARRRAAA